MKFVNYTEIHAVYFRGQFWYQIIPIMQISSPHGWFPVVPGDHGRHICFPWCRFTSLQGLHALSSATCLLIKEAQARGSWLYKGLSDLFFEVELEASCQKQPSPRTLAESVVVGEGVRGQRMSTSLLLLACQKQKKPGDIHIQ